MLTVIAHNGQGTALTRKLKKNISSVLALVNNNLFVLEYIVRLVKLVASSSVIADIYI